MKQADRASRPRYYYESDSDGSDYDEEMAEASSNPQKPQETEENLQMVLEGTINMIFERRGESALNLKFIINGDWS